MIELIKLHASKEGFTPSRLNGVQFIKSSQQIPRSPALYNPSVVIVAQGQKKGYLGDSIYTYDPDNYLVMSVPLPFECETNVASPEEPMLGISIGVDSVMLGELLLDMNEFSTQADTPRGVFSSVVTKEIRSAATRLLECLQDPMETHILGRQIVREIIFRVLGGEQGWGLRALAGRNGGFIQVANALKLIHTAYDKELDVATLAKRANMSPSNFHQVFKTVTTTTPIQYIKSLRLHKARMLMVQEGMSASTAAGKVGYVSPSQFSREFKRFFGSSPSEEALKMRDFGFSLPLPLLRDFAPAESHGIHSHGFE
jgi:AraC-like DNA-binding protein